MNERGSSDGPRFLVIGRITKPHGVRGEVRVVPMTDQPERFGWLEQVYVGEKSPKLMEVEYARLHKKMVLLKLVDVNGRHMAEPLRGQLLQVLEDDAIPLEEGEYYLYQLRGLNVVTDDGNDLGKLVHVMETGANNVFVVKGKSGEVLLPDIPEIVQEIDFENGRMTVKLMDGLM